MTIADIAVGVLIGAALGIVNALILRFGVRLAVKCSRRIRAALAVAASYAVRYLVIAAVVYFILKRGNPVMAVTTLIVLGLTTIIGALVQRRNCRGAGAPPAGINDSVGK